jgi:hypothetical protein
MNLFDIYYNDLEKILNNAKRIIEESVISSSFTQNTIDWYISLIKWFQISQQNWYSNFINYNNWINNFFNTYIEKQKSTQQSLEILKQQINLTKQSLSINNTNDEINHSKLISNNKNQLEVSKLNIKSLENSYDSLSKSKNITLKQYQNNITEAQIAYNDIKNTYQKMFVKAPISWTISSIKIDLGEEVNTWAPLFQIVNDSSQEIEVSFTKNELEYLKWNDLVNFVYNNKVLTWNIYSISTVSDQNFNYKWNINFNQNIDLLWNFVEVKIPISISKILIPLDIIKITAKNKGFIYTYNEEKNEVTKKHIELWKIWWDKIEIKTKLDSNTSIILSNMNNYDKNLFTIVLF